MKPEVEIDYHTGKYLPYSFPTVCGFCNGQERWDLRLMVLIQEDQKV